MPLRENNSLNICRGIYCRVSSIFIRLESLRSVKASTVQKRGDRKTVRPWLPATEPSCLRHAQHRPDSIMLLSKFILLLHLRTYAIWQTLCSSQNQLLAKSKISKYVGFSGFLRDLRIKLSIKFPSPSPPKKGYKTCCHGVLFYLTLAYLPLLSALLRSLVFHCIL